MSDPQFTMIETERMNLRMLTPESYDYIFQNYTDEELKNFFGLKSEVDLFFEKHKYKNGLSTYRTSFLHFQMLHKSSHQLIGGCGFHTWFTEHARAEIGYIIYDESYKRRGYMKEALSEILKHGFTVLNLNRVEAFVSPQNEASVKLLKGFNFVEEGKLREHYYKNKVHEDSLVFGLLRKEYIQLK
jgi:[ribosomal protein S5]-alanine N-acetyltransferase